VLECMSAAVAVFASVCRTRENAVSRFCPGIVPVPAGINGREPGPAPATGRVQAPPLPPPSATGVLSEKLASEGTLSKILLVRTRTCPPASAETLAAARPVLHSAEVNVLQFFMMCLAGWVNRNQQNVIEYLQEEAHPWPSQEYLTGSP